ncbi:large subunit ribosomal protein L29 [Bacilli bacterium PM5-3]|nr:large subunit ribosomal protein L29 [Bacilli bacterium PM5-3]MDH6604192.1 large subunit ribosomal protein L29 [Bacilli bacterium PM5-9]
MRIEEIREKTVSELNDKVLELKKELFELRFQQATGQLERPSQLREVKKTIARIKTVITEKEMQE